MINTFADELASQVSARFSPSAPPFPLPPSVSCSFLKLSFDAVDATYFVFLETSQRIWKQESFVVYLSSF